MSGLTWVKVSTDVAAHPKTRALGHRMGTSTRDAVGALATIWAWFGRFYPDGSAPDTVDTVRDIEAAAMWAGEDGALFAFLLELALLERRRRRVIVHGWDEWSGTYEAEKERDRARKRAKRAEERGVCPPDVLGQEPDSPDQKEKEKENQKKNEKKPPPSASLRSASELPPDAPPLARWLVETYPDVREPVAFARAQAQANPGIDLLAEARKAHAWEVAHPERRKRKHGPFLSRWFAKAQDEGPRLGTAPATPLRRPATRSPDAWERAWPVRERWWELLTAQQMQSLRQERVRLCPQIDVEAPPECTGYAGANGEWLTDQRVVDLVKSYREAAVAGQRAAGAA